MTTVFVRRCHGNPESWALDLGAGLIPATFSSLDSLAAFVAGSARFDSPTNLLVTLDRAREQAATQARRAQELAEAQRDAQRARNRLDRLQRQADADLHAACEAE